MDASDTMNQPDAGKRAIRLADIADLFTRPRKFFGGQLDLGGKAAFLPAVWILGISAQFDRFDTLIMRHELGTNPTAWKLVEGILTGSWLGFWAFCLGFGVLSAALLYLIGGWWYRVRLRWAGASADVDKLTPRQVYVWSNLVVTLPQLLLVVGFTAVYPSYYAAYNSDELLSISILLLVFWSVGVSYVGATETFELVTWKARLWFLVAPLVFYLIAVGALVFIITLFAG